MNIFLGKITEGQKKFLCSIDLTPEETINRLNKILSIEDRFDGKKYNSAIAIVVLERLKEKENKTFILDLLAKSLEYLLTRP